MIKIACKECKELGKKFKEKVREYDELKERFKAIAADYCFCLSTDFD